MMKLTRTGIGLLTAQYRSVLKKCFLINAGLFLALAPNVADATGTRHVVNNGQTVSAITETFSNNEYSDIKGGFIYNAGTINSITSTIQSNTANAITGINNVPLIYNQGYIVSITGNVASNRNIVTQIADQGGEGAYLSNENGGIIDTINITATNNAVSGYENSPTGGLIFNKASTIRNLYGSYIGNIVSSASSNYQTNYYGSDGGVLANYLGASVTNINAIFNNNRAVSTGGMKARGGAIAQLNSGGFDMQKITSLLGSFSGNYAESTTEALGGAIYNSAYSTITNIGTATNKVTFSGNYAKSESGNAFGGAIYNEGTIDNIYADFTGNYVTTGSGFARGGSIYNTGTIGSIGSANNKVIFQNNIIEVINDSSEAYAAGIDNTGKIDYIYADFINNQTKGKGYEYASYTDGAAIANFGEIGTITGNISGSSVNNQGGGLYNGGTEGGSIKNLNVNFTGNSALIGGAISNEYGTIESLTGIFTNNTATSSGGAISTRDGTMKNVSGQFIENKASYGGAMWIALNIENMYNTYFEGNIATTRGGAIDIAQRGTITFTGTNTFTNNKANGALNDIYNAGTININGGTTTLNSGYEDSTSAVLSILSGATFKSTNSTVINGSVSNAGTANFSGIFNNLGSFSNSNSLTFNNATLSGNSITGTTGSINFTGTNTVNMPISYTGTKTVSSGTTSFNDEVNGFTVASGATANVAADDITAAVTNNGTLNLDEGTLSTTLSGNGNLRLTNRVAMEVTGTTGKLYFSASDTNYVDSIGTAASSITTSPSTHTIATTQAVKDVLDNNYYRNIEVSRAEKLKMSPLAERSECIQGSTDFFKKFEDALTITAQSRHDGLIFVANDNHATTGNTTMYKKEA